MIGRLLSSSSRVLGGTRCFSLKDSYRVGFDKCSVFKANCSLNTINLVKRLERREFQTGVVDSYRVQEKQSFSSLQKHLKPDGLTGSERRRKLVKDAKNQRFVAKPVNKNTRGFVPSRFKLTPIPSDATTTYSNARNDNKDYESFSGKLKFKEREKKRKEKRGAKEVGTSNGVKDVTKFDMADLDTMDNLQAQIQEATFDNLGLRPEVSEAVKQLFPTLEPGQLKPTEIQALAIPEILQKKHSHVLCAAETGSGKTLAYLLTIVNQLKEQEVNAPKLVTRVEVDKPKLKRNVDFGEDSADPFLNGTVPTLPTDSITPSATSSPVLESPELRLLTTSSVRKLNRPRAIVLVPSCVLASQVYSVAKKLSHFAKFRVVLVNRDTVRKHLNRRLQTPVDLLITTPNSLLNHVKNDLISLSEVNQLTIDEADTLFEKGFGEEVKSIIKSLQSTNSQLRRQYQLTVVSATLPKMVLQLLDREFPDLVRITTPSLHKSISRCKQHFVDLKDYKGNRSLGLLDTLRQFEQRTSVTNQKKEKDRILIFCNTRKAVTIVQAFLSERSIPTLSFYGGDPYKNHPPASPQQIHQFLYPDSDTSNVYDFSHPDRISTSDPQTTPLEETDPTEDPSLDDTTEPAPSTTPSLNVDGAKILICTDLASRGLDTTAVNHVIMYDFPTAVVDYLHRCGRTARAGQSGIVTSLVGKRDRAFAERIRRSVRTRSVLA